MAYSVQVRAALALGVLALIAAPAHEANAGSCPPVITACGCTITDAASHKLGNDISAADGLTGKGDCIDIKHKNAKLDGFFFNIDGDASPGVGIRILPGATRASVQNLTLFSPGMSASRTTRITPPSPTSTPTTTAPRESF